MESRCAFEARFPKGFRILNAAKLLIKLPNKYAVGVRECVCVSVG